MQNAKIKVQNDTDTIEHPRQSRDNAKFKIKYSTKRSFVHFPF